jgi:hypothetical protein
LTKLGKLTGADKKERLELRHQKIFALRLCHKAQDVFIWKIASMSVELSGDLFS